MGTLKNIIGPALCALSLVTLSYGARAEDEIKDSTCEDLTPEDIPLASYRNGLAMPESAITINQAYNTSYDDGYGYDGVWMYGHDGLDTEGASDTAGENDVYDILRGIVVLSKSRGVTGGWGESIIVASRMNAFSEEIITHHYHHLHVSEDGVTTRLYNACDIVEEYDTIAGEGNTGHSNGSHLHLSIRRWENIAALNEAVAAGGKALFGYGYTFGDDDKLFRNLDPEGFLFGSFLDYPWDEQDTSPYAWSFPYASQMRIIGIDYGLYDGRFGAGEPVTRRQAARWMKIGAMLDSYRPSVSTFTDVPLTDKDSPYIERLVMFPSGHPVIDPEHTCVDQGYAFCPDAGVNRAEALKMVIMAFYGDEFIEEYHRTIWNQSYEIAILLLNAFVDVPAIAWYAPYIYFGVNKGFVTEQDLFHPYDTIRKEELAKWIVLGSQHLGAVEDGICSNVICPDNHYCSVSGGGCVEVPACVPSETVQCEVGGGYAPPSDPETDPENCQCLSGICCDGCNYKSAGEVCEQWYVYRCEGPNPGQDSQKALVREYCSGVSWDCVGQQEQLGWQTYEDCSSSQSCEIQNGMPECVGSCADTYSADSAEACYCNPQGSGNPTLCLEVEKISGASFQYRVCKDGTFQNDFTYRLKDDNNNLNFTQYSGSAGASCTPWKTFSVSYIDGYGGINGAGLHAEVVSPSGCAQSECLYRTGTVTVVKECI
jgi:murein DD-endopeptidase MepM/ murein hydrolase activator NlpD